MGRKYEANPLDAIAGIAGEQVMATNAILFNPPDGDAKPSVMIDYNAELTARKFHNSDARIRVIKGCVASGKSSACVMELLLRAMKQRAYNGVRSSKWAVIRNTYPMLMTTTLVTFTDWIKERDLTPQGYRFTLNRSKPMIGKLWMALPDGTQVDAEFIFLALDDPGDADKLKSLELTGAYCNEMQLLDKHIFVTVNERIGRFPSVRNGGFSWTGIIGDFNPPSTDHWLYELFMVLKPPGYEIYHQPPALLELPKKDPKDPTVYVDNVGQDPRYPPAENIKWLGEGFRYYHEKTYGTTRDYIRVMVMGLWGNVADGKVVYSEFLSETHIADTELEPMRGLPVVCAFDYGLSPACVIAQISPRGQLIILDEIVCGMSEKELRGKEARGRYFGDTGIRNFATNVLKPYLANRYNGMEVIYTGDPAGSQRSPTDESTVIEELARCGLQVSQARTNKFIARKEAVEGFMLKRDGFKVSPRCSMLIEGFQKQYKYRTVKKPDGEGYTTEPEKNIWSHVHDACQYAALYLEDGGRGVGRMIGGGTGGRSGAREVVDSGFNAYV